VRLINRLTALEKSMNTAPMLTLDVVSMPTDEQKALIDQCTRTGRRLIVFYEPGNTLWMSGVGVSPWEATL
jgi:hypothetical protein